MNGTELIQRLIDQRCLTATQLVKRLLDEQDEAEVELTEPTPHSLQGQTPLEPCSREGLKAMALLTSLVPARSAARSGLIEMGGDCAWDLHEAAEIIATLLLDEEPQGPLAEASVHRPKRGGVWVATFTGPTGGRVWRSTGLRDYEQALLLAKHWEAQARAERARLGRTAQKPSGRVGHRGPDTGTYRLTQKEVAELLNMSERGVREVQKRALRKLSQNPILRQIWQRYLAGELDERRGEVAGAGPG